MRSTGSPRTVGPRAGGDGPPPSAAEGQHLQHVLGRPGWRKLSAMRRASRLNDIARPVTAWRRLSRSAPATGHLHHAKSRRTHTRHDRPVLPSPGPAPAIRALMSNDGIKIGMTPPHPGAFIRIEALEEFGLNVSAAAWILGVRRATLSDLGERERLAVARNGVARREGVRPQHGPAVADAGMARRDADAGARQRDRRSAVSAGMIGSPDRGRGDAPRPGLSRRRHHRNAPCSITPCPALSLALSRRPRRRAGRWRFPARFGKRLVITVEAAA